MVAAQAVERAGVGRAAAAAELSREDTAVEVVDWAAKEESMVAPC